MECNKDSALIVKEMAEKKLLQRDFGGAKALAMKARGLYPNLDGLPQLLATIEVYISAENRVGGEVDWYRVLGAQPLFDDETIRRCYRKMALNLHPDKNKSVGADGAFNLISQAWSFLSDKAKRTTYDQKYRLYKGISGGKPPVPARENGFPGGKPPVPASQNGFPGGKSPVPARENGFPGGKSPVPASQNGFPGGKPPVPASQNGFFNTAYQKDSDQRSAAHPNPTPRPPFKLQQTFWTKCTNCRAQFEYLTVYCNRNLVCTSCSKPFLASEASLPPVYTNASFTSGISQVKKYDFNSTGLERNCHVSSRTPMSAVNSSLGSGPFSTPGGISSVRTSASTSAGVPGIFMMSSENLKRKREDSTPIMWEEVHFRKIPAVERTVTGSAFQSSCFGLNPVPKGDWSRKKRHTDEHKVDSDKRGMETEMTPQKGMNMANEFGSQKNSFDIGKINVARNSKRNGIRDMPQLQIKNILMEKARKEIRKKLDEWKASCVSNNLNKSKNTPTEVRVKDKEKAINGVKPGAQEFEEKVINGVNQGAQEFVDSETDDRKCIPSDSEVPSLLMSVPDPDFHDFDGDRIENTFRENQVWAVYDDDDGMPRYYAFIHSVISKNPFRMKIGWLNSKTNDEFAPIKWVASGFPKTTGDLRIGKRDIYSTLNSFSHRVKWTKGSRGLIHIYPKKGDVWALYRNWSPDWDEFTKDDIIHKYDMVEVLEDYNEEHGVNVAPVVKAAGFKTVFSQNADPRKIRNIPKAEMFRFSHQVPSYFLTGEEGPNAPKGFLELDPASTPMELLQEVTEAPEQEMETTVEKSSKDELRHKGNSSEDGFVERGQTTKKEDSVEDVARKVAAEPPVEKAKKPEIFLVYKRKRRRVQ